MKVIFRFQDVLEIVNDGVPNLAANVDETQRTQHKELKRKILKACSSFINVWILISLRR
jgi:hypothetical protein